MQSAQCSFKSATKPYGPPTLLVRCFFRGSFVNPQCKTAVWLPNLYLHCSIVMQVTNTASQYLPTLGADVKSHTTILIFISDPWAVNENSFQKVAQWAVFRLATVSEIPATQFLQVTRQSCQLTRNLRKSHASSFRSHAHTQGTQISRNF